MADENFVRQHIIYRLLEFKFAEKPFGELLFTPNKNESLKDCINRQSTIVILQKIKEFELNESYKWNVGVTVQKLFILVNEWLFRIRMTNEIATIKNNLQRYADNVQNNVDVVNLFTDIEKNRIGLEEQIGKVNNRLDRLEHKIDNIETSISQILGLLQKS